jgi:hypothetical protein
MESAKQGNFEGSKESPYDASYNRPSQSALMQACDVLFILLLCYLCLLLPILLTGKVLVGG